MSPARTLLTLCLLTGAQFAHGQGEPVWKRTATPLHFGYHADSKQTFGQHSNTFYLPGQFSPGEAGIDDQLGCRNNDAAPPFWYADGAKLEGPRQITTPAVGAVFITPGDQRMRGLAFRGTWRPALSAPGAVAAVFYSSNHCYMGTVEYGFQREFAYSSPAYVGFYYSRYANCRTNGSMLCHVKDENSKASVVGECVAGINLPDDIDHGNPNKSYEAYIFWDAAAKKHKFKVQVVDVTTRRRDWECVVDPSAADPFSGDSRCHRKVNGQTNFSQNSCDATFPISSLYSVPGSVTATVNTNNAKFPEHTPALRVDEIRIGN